MSRAPAIPRLSLLFALLLMWEACAWYAGAHLGPRAALALPRPTAVLDLAVVLLRDGTLVHHAASSTVRVCTGVVAACVVGVAAGVGASLWPIAGGFADALLRVLRPVPPVAWIPISILWFQVTDLQQTFIVFVGTVFIVLAGTLDGIRGTDPIYSRAAQNLGASSHQVGRYVVLMAALPEILTAIREAVAFGWFMIVAVEFVSAADGLGFLILEGRNTIDSPRVVVGMLAVGSVSYGFDLVLRSIQGGLLEWREV